MTPHLLRQMLCSHHMTNAVHALLEGRDPKSFSTGCDAVDTPNSDVEQLIRVGGRLMATIDMTRRGYHGWTVGIPPFVIAWLVDELGARGSVAPESAYTWLHDHEREAYRELVNPMLDRIEAAIEREAETW